MADRSPDPDLVDLYRKHETSSGLSSNYTQSRSLTDNDLQMECGFIASCKNFDTFMDRKPKSGYKLENLGSLTLTELHSIYMNVEISNIVIL